MAKPDMVGELVDGFDAFKWVRADKLRPAPTNKTCNPVATLELQEVLAVRKQRYVYTST